MAPISIIKHGILSIIFLSAGTLVPADNSYADSKKVVLYDISVPYWDIKPNETLGEIVDELISKEAQNNRLLKQRLMRHIVESNQHAFINLNPNRMIAHRRLWFTNAKPITRAKNGKIKRYSWGYIKEVDSE